MGGRKWGLGFTFQVSFLQTESFYKVTAPVRQPSAFVATLGSGNFFVLLPFQD